MNYNEFLEKKPPNKGIEKDRWAKIKCCVCGSEFFVLPIIAQGKIGLIVGNYSCPYCDVDNEKHILEVLEGENNDKEKTMTSKEALQDLFTISNKITKDKLNLDTKEIFERYKVIREDLEVLEALKRNVGIRIAIQEWANKEAKVFPNDRKIVKEWLEEK